MTALDLEITQVQGALARVLARPEFQVAEPSLLTVWYREIRRRVVEAIISLLQRIPFNLGESTLKWVLWATIALLACLIAVHIGRALGRGRRSRPGGEAGAVTYDATGPVDWSAAANVAAREGRFRDAVLALYQAMLGRLDGQGVLRYDAAKTPGDYRREVRSRPEVAGRFDRFLGFFEPVAFGGRPTDRSTFDRISGLAREVVGE